jgi:NadR type nicotinamide-nucleotide adenylyltransferase
MEKAIAKKMIIRVAVIGPESSGKTTLSHELAEHYQTTWVAEYSRSYIAGLTRAYTQQDIEKIALAQLKQEDEALLHAQNYFFADTELIIAKVWSLDVFHYCPEWIEKKIPELAYDLYLLTSPDLEWIADPVRENAGRRDYFFDWYKRELETYQFPYFIISGHGKYRMQNAVSAIENYFNK